MDRWPKLYIKKDNQPEIEASEVIEGLHFLGSDSAPMIINTYQQNVGQDGQQLMFKNYDKTTENANFYIKFGDWYDYKLVKQDVMRLFNCEGLMRIRTDAEPAMVKYVRPTTFDFKPTEDLAHDSLFTIAFDNPSGYKYSLVRSDSIYTYESDSWQLGMNLPNGIDLSYRFSTNRFLIYNASDIRIDPYYQKHDLKIICHFNGGGLSVVNNTNGSEWSYNAKAVKTDTIILDGISTSLNGSPASSSTDYGNITLEPGYNDMSVTGASDIDITFSFPFVYLG